MRAVIINEEGIVINVCEVDENSTALEGMLFIEANIGDKIVNGEVVPKDQIPTPAIVPQLVTRRQARQALLIRNLLDLVEPAIDSIEDPLQRGLALIEWQDATEFERQRPLVIQIGQALGLDDEGLDELFIFAATL